MTSIYLLLPVYVLVRTSKELETTAKFFLALLLLQQLAEKWRGKCKFLEQRDAALSKHIESSAGQVVVQASAPQREVKAHMQKQTQRSEESTPQIPHKKPLSIVMTEQYIQTCSAFQQKVDQEKASTTITNRSVKFVDELSMFVGNFQETYRNAPTPPLIGFESCPHYEAMIRKFIRGIRPKFYTLTNSFALLQRNKGNESRLFQQLSQAHGVPNPLDRFYAPIKTVPPTWPSPTSAEVACPVRRIFFQMSMIERLLLAQERWQKEGKPYQMDIGFHYTSPACIDRIQADGLLKREEREQKQIPSKHNGSRYGEGIYTANDAQSFSDYGSIGLMVVRLKGVMMDHEEAECGYKKGNDSITNEKKSIVVLKEKFQVLPVLQFSAETFSTNQQGLAYLRYLTVKLQCLVDEHLSIVRPGLPRKGPTDRRPSKRKRIISISDRISFPTFQHNPSSTIETINYEAPLYLNQVDPAAFYSTVGLHRYHDDCSVCLNPLTESCAFLQDTSRDRVVRLNACGHEFHEECAIQILILSHVCPICRTLQTLFRGKMPSGRMVVACDESKHCEGFEHVGTIVIRYMIPAGVQKVYHVDPGRPYSSIDRTAYIPQTLEGIKLLHRLKEAFKRGLTFTVGPKLVDGQVNQVTWSSITHKTSLTGGPTCFGYPDPLFIKRCHHELDTLGIPP